MTTRIRSALAPAAGLLLLLLGRPALGGEIVSVGAVDVSGGFVGGSSGGCASCGGRGGGVTSTGNCCGPKGPCPKPFCHVYEGPPRLKFKCGCPRPVCDPCHLEHFGYYPTCWSPWPYPPNWSHCPYPTAAAMLPAPAVPPYTPKISGGRLPEGVRPLPSHPGTYPGVEPPSRPRSGELPPPKIEDLPRPEGQSSLYLPPPYTRPAVRLVR